MAVLCAAVPWVSPTRIVSRYGTVPGDLGSLGTVPYPETLPLPHYGQIQKTKN